MTTENVMPRHFNAKREQRVTRVTMPQELREKSILRLEERITPELERKFQSVRESTRYLANAAAPLRALVEQDQHAAASLDALHKLASEEQQRLVGAVGQHTVSGPLRTFNFTANPGFTILAPPYDVEWTTGAAYADQYRGELSCLVVGGFVAAAVGVFLSSPVPSFIRFSPEAPVSYSWAHWPYRGPVSGKGGVGMLAYRNDEPQPFLEKEALLWSDSRNFPSPAAGDSGASFVSAALPGDFLMPMEPDHTYIVWIWCWGMAHTSVVEGHEGIAFDEIQCSIPFIVIDSGPAQHIA